MAACRRAMTTGPALVLLTLLARAQCWVVGPQQPPPARLADDRAALSRPRACAAAAEELDGGALEETSFWDDFCERTRSEAAVLGLEMRRVSYANGKLSVQASGGGVDQLQELNRLLSTFIDAREAAEEETVSTLPPFLLEVSSPGLSGELTSDADFAAFKGFPVVVTTSEEFKSKTQWEGTLVGRDDEKVAVNLKGRKQEIPWAIVSSVRLPNAKRESGDVGPP